MENCTHDLIEWQEVEQEMHGLGWVCQRCGYLEIGEYHHRTWCRGDFCGVDPMAEEEAIEMLAGITRRSVAAYLAKK